jgi:nicotinamidase-related amidase
MLNPDRSVLVVIDVQEKLSAVMHEQDALIENAVKAVAGAKILGLPIIRTEQNPKGLGETIPKIAELLSDVPSVTKLSFSCCGEPNFMNQLAALNRRQVLVLGIESHVCVYQTVADLLEEGYETQVIADAISSRTLENKTIGLERCKELGASITSAETALFELLKKAEGDKFKQMLKIVK